MALLEQIDIDTILAQVRTALASGDWQRAAALVESLRPPDQADLFGELPEVEQDQLLPRLEVEDSADILEELEEVDAAEVASRLGPKMLARIVDEMEPDEAADLLGDELIRRMIQVWLSTPFDGGRHARRVKKIMAAERHLCEDGPDPAATAEARRRRNARKASREKAS